MIIFSTQDVDDFFNGMKKCCPTFLFDLNLSRLALSMLGEPLDAGVM